MYIEQQIITVASALSNTANQVITTDYIPLNDGAIALYCSLLNGGTSAELLTSVGLDWTMPGATANVTTITADGVDNQTHTSKGLAQWVGTDTTKGQAGIILPVDANLVNSLTKMPQFIPTRVRFVLTRSAAAGTATYTLIVKKLRIKDVDNTQRITMTAPTVA